MTAAAERIRRRHAALRRAGMRRLQIWVPDTRRRGFAEECRRQSLSLRDDPQEQEILDRLEGAADREGWR
jgi:antidote-toxin recognition MazE-like antitoxin